MQKHGARAVSYLLSHKIHICFYIVLRIIKVKLHKLYRCI